MDSKIFSLSQVTASIHKTLSQRYSSSFWVTAEMNRLGYQPSSGHSFPELVEKRNDKIIAQMRAFILKNDMQRIRQKFLAGAHEELQDNIKILFLAEISYHTIHGLSLQIRDIDPTYTLGDLEKEKIECIKKLKDQGLFDLNRKQFLSPAPKIIAVISSTTSKGFEDFLFTLEKAAPKIKFQIELFSAALQGSEAPNSIINQLNIIKHKLHNFDAVAIIRGGGGDVGLSCYNDYQLATTIARFPLPVFIGVGHKSNETIAELIAHGSGITPTAVAEIFVQRCIGFINTIEQVKTSIIHLSNQLIAESFTAIKNMAQIIHHNSVYQFRNEEISLSQTIHRLTRLALSNASKEDKKIDMITQQINHITNNTILSAKNVLTHRILSALNSHTCRNISQQSILLEQAVRETKQKLKYSCEKQVNQLVQIETIIKFNNPEHTLAKGYTITRRNGKAVHDVNELKEGDNITTQFSNGHIESQLTTIYKPNEHTQ